ncbi:MAG: aminoacyl-tRNA hydrolase [Patescibacteria group bacterium]
MLVIAGLGNPTEEYKNTRHNIGYRIVIDLANKLGLNFLEDASTYRANMYFKTKRKDDEVVLTLPLGYMNNSGDAIRQVFDFYRDADTKDLWIIHDDTEIPFGEIRVKYAGTSAGHNGIKSIDKAIGNKYWRMRVGIGKPKYVGFDLARFVLSPFTDAEQDELATIIDQASSYLLKSLDKGTIESTTFNAKEIKK